MSDTTLVHIFTQYYENYGSPENPHWKPKGGQTFSVNVESDVLMYADKDALADAMTHAITQYDSFMFKHEYVSHELIFHDILPLDDKAFSKFLYDEEKKRYEASK